jgi:hypothetical protein
MTNGYNGWTNFETWKANLELVDGLDMQEFVEHEAYGMENIAEERDTLVDTVAGYIESTAFEIIEDQASGWALDLATVLLGRVNWEEIAEHIVDDYIAEQGLTN